MNTLLQAGLNGRACSAKLLERSRVPVPPEKRFLIRNAHETVSDFTRAKINQLLADLEQSGHNNLATQLRQQHAAKLKVPGKKPWWRVW